MKIRLEFMFFFSKMFYAWAEWEILVVAVPFYFIRYAGNLPFSSEIQGFIRLSYDLHSPDDTTFVTRNIPNVLGTYNTLILSLISFPNTLWLMYFLWLCIVNQHYISKCWEHLFLFHTNKPRITYKPLFRLLK